MKPKLKTHTWEDVAQVMNDWRILHGYEASIKISPVPNWKFAITVRVIAEYSPRGWPIEYQTVRELSLHEMGVIESVVMGMLVVMFYALEAGEADNRGWEVPRPQILNK